MTTPPPPPLPESSSPAMTQVGPIWRDDLQTWMVYRLSPDPNGPVDLALFDVRKQDWLYKGEVGNEREWLLARHAGRLQSERDEARDALLHARGAISTESLLRRIDSTGSEEKPHMIGSGNQQDYRKAFLQLHFPNQYVVVITIPDTATDDLVGETAAKIQSLTGLDRHQIIQAALLNDEFVVSFGNDQQKAVAFFREFPEEEYPYTLLFGPVDVSHPKAREIVHPLDFGRGTWLDENT